MARILWDRQRRKHLPAESCALCEFLNNIAADELPLDSSAPSPDDASITYWQASGVWRCQRFADYC